MFIAAVNQILASRRAEKTAQLALETRQAQLYDTNIRETQNKDWYVAYINVLYNQEWNDFEEFWQKYGPLTNPDAYADFLLVGELFHKIGVLVEMKTFDPIYQYKHSGPLIIRLWERLEPIVKGIRKQHIGLSKMWTSFENLYNEFKQLEQHELNSIQ